MWDRFLKVLQSITAWTNTSRATISSFLTAFQLAGAFVAKFTSRWQEYLLWMPLCILLFVGAWLVFGALDRTALKDMMPLAILLPLKVLYCFAALAATHQVRRRWRFRMKDAQQQEYWTRLMAGEPGPVVIYCVDAAFTLCALYWLLQFFLLAS